MRILVISGSPRKKGNTMAMASIIEKRMIEIEPSVEFEYLYLIDSDLRYCRGCSHCLSHGGPSCPLKDDAPVILKKMHDAQGIIFASPGYAAMVSGLFKNFIDRFMYLDHIPELMAKPVIILSTSGGDGVMGAPNYMARKSFQWWGCNIVDTIGIGHAIYSINRGARQRTEKRLKRTAGKFFDAARLQGKIRPGFRQYMCFVYNKMELRLSSSVMPYRFKVWQEKGWMKSRYYYPVYINPLFHLIGGIYSILTRFMYRVILGNGTDQKLAQYVRNN